MSNDTNNANTLQASGDAGTHIRTVNGGSPELITTRAALHEIEAVMNAGHDDGTEMYGSGSTYAITYADGRKVDIRPATPEEIAELTAPEATIYGRPARIITVNGKRYIVDSQVSQPRTYTTSNGDQHTWPGGVKYQTERNGKPYGPIRTALGNSRPGTVGAAIWADSNR